MTVMNVVAVPSMPILTIAVCSGAFFGFSPISISYRKYEVTTIIIRITTTVVINIKTAYLRNNLHISTPHLCLVSRYCQ